MHRPLRRQLGLFIENLPAQAPIHPLHDHVDAAAMFVGKNFHHTGMIQNLADFFLTMEAVKQGGIALDLRMRYFDGYLPAVPGIRTPIDGGHSAAGDKGLNPVMIELIAAMESHRNRSGRARSTANATPRMQSQLHHARKSVRKA